MKICKLFIILISIIVSSPAYSQLDRQATTTLVRCAAFYRLYADIHGGKNLNGFLESRPEWKENSLKQFYNPKDSDRARQFAASTLANARIYTGNLDLDNATSYFYDKWAIAFQEDFNISPIRAERSFERYTAECSRGVEIALITLKKVRPDQQDFTKFFEASKYSSAQKNEAKMALRNLQKPIPREDRYVAVNIKVGSESEANLEIEQWVKKYNLQVKIGKSGYFDSYLSGDGFNLMAYIIGPISPTVSDQILSNKSGSNFFNILDKFGKTSNVDKDVFDKSRPFSLNSSIPTVIDTNQSSDKASLLQKIIALHPEMFSQLGMLYAFSQADLLGNKTIIENEVRNFSDQLLSSKDNTGAFVNFHSSKIRMIDEIKQKKITLSDRDFMKWVNESATGIAAKYDSLSGSRNNLIKTLKAKSE